MEGFGIAQAGQRMMPRRLGLRNERHGIRVSFLSCAPLTSIALQLVSGRSPTWSPNAIETFALKHLVLF